MLFFVLLFQTVQAGTIGNPIAWAGHWAIDYLTSGIAEKWGDYENNSSPEKTVTRAQFLRMLEKAVKLTPGSAAAKFYSDAAANMNADPKPFADTSGHWVQEGGWLKAATDFGLVIPSDYEGLRFGPDNAITRQEAMVMIARALGAVYTAAENKGAYPFADWNGISGWAKGYIKQLADDKLVLGYPDKTVRADNKLTLAEATALIDRAKRKMAQGADADIKVYARDEAGQNADVQMDLPVAAQVIDGKVYIPVRSIFDSGLKLYNIPGTMLYKWDAKNQMMIFDYGVMFQFQAGNDYCGFYNTMLPDRGEFNDLAARVRVYNGELMIPVWDNNSPANIRYTGDKTWDEASKTLTVEVFYPNSPIS